MVMVVVHTKHVGEPTMSVNPASIGVEALNAVAAGKRWERVHNIDGAAGPIHSEVDVVLSAAVPAGPTWSTAESAGTERHHPGTTSRTEVVHDAKVDGIRAALV